MKKVLSIAFAITVVCALLMICASAATGSASLSASASEVSRGDTFSVTVSVSGATDVGSIGIMPVYTSAAIECTGGSWLIAGSLSDVSASDAVIAFQPTQDVSGSVLTLNFKVKSNAPLGANIIKLRKEPSSEMDLALFLQKKLKKF